jgi:hypothetical protein
VLAGTVLAFVVAASASSALRSQNTEEGASVASRTKTKTTMAKLNRERKVVERRLAKQARKDARRQEAREAAESPETAPLDAPAALD